MLRRNIDVTVRLVSGAISIVMGIYATCMSIQFDHIDAPCDIERVTSRFMLSRICIYTGNSFPLYFIMLLLNMVWHTLHCLEYIH
uniref:Uncharacterized protein n=1 Tax=Amphimedon queenslandica TaxID=400682 RepID=A0A1X7U1Q1_AMPQE